MSYIDDYIWLYIPCPVDGCNNNYLLEITDDKQEALDLGVIRSSIDNPQAFDILKAILPEEA